MKGQIHKPRGRPRLSEEERKKNRAASLARYRIKIGMMPKEIGRPPKDEIRNKEVIGGALVVKKEPRQIDLPHELPENPTVEEMRRFVLEMASAAAKIGSAPAMIAAAQTLQKEIDRWERNKPPEIVKPNPRPRVAVEIEIKTTVCPHCGKTHEV